MRECTVEELKQFIPLGGVVEACLVTTETNGIMDYVKFSKDVSNFEFPDRSFQNEHVQCVVVGYRREVARWKASGTERILGLAIRVGRRAAGVTLVRNWPLDGRHSCKYTKKTRDSIRIARHLYSALASGSCDIPAPPTLTSADV